MRWGWIYSGFLNNFLFNILEKGSWLHEPFFFEHEKLRNLFMVWLALKGRNITSDGCQAIVAKYDGLHPSLVYAALSGLACMEFNRARRFV